MALLDYIDQGLRQIPQPPAGSPLDEAIRGYVGFGDQAVDLGRAAIENSLGAPAQAMRWLVTPRKPPVGPQGAPGAPSSPMAAPGAGPQQDPAFDAFEHANQALGSALQQPHTDVRSGFSWGKDVPLGENGRPAIDSVLTDPTSGRQVQAHESTGGGGFSQTSLKDIPFSQWPESEKQAAFQEAALQKAQTEARDPFQTGAYAQRKAIDMTAAAGERSAQIGEDRAQYTQLRKQLDDSLRALESDPRTQALPEAEKAKARAQFQSRFDEDWDAYNKARAAARLGALPTGFLPRS